jgi:glycosyltransferase involved in cell wall biosynthesis
MNDSANRSGSPRIAVIIPALDAAVRLPAALESLAAQQADFAADVEAVLVDGGSRDATIAIASAYPGLRVIAASGSSIYEALNRGIAETSAPAIVLLNADDTLPPGALSAWWDALARAPEAGIARGRANFVEIDDAGEVKPLIEANRRASTRLTLELVLRGPFAINSMCIRRLVFERVGRFDTRYRFAADRDWMLSAYIAGIMIVELQWDVYRYLSHAGSSTLDRARRNYAKIRCEHLSIARRHLRAPSTSDPELRRALQRWHAVETGMLALHHAGRFALVGLAATLVRASYFAPAWPLTLVGETARHLVREKRSRTS